MKRFRIAVLSVLICVCAISATACHKEPTVSGEPSDNSSDGVPSEYDFEKSESDSAEPDLKEPPVSETLTDDRSDESSEELSDDCHIAMTFDEIGLSPPTLSRRSLPAR